MQIILNTTYKPKLLFKNKVFYSHIGINGFLPKYKKKEGDKSTPFGKWKIITIFLRKDKKINLNVNKKIHSKIKTIKKNLGWCDDVKNRKYNKLINLKKIKEISNLSYENLYREDDLYDIVIELNYNQNPVIKNKGSAIFIHCSNPSMTGTAGCIALKKNNLKFLINNLQKSNYLYIR